MAKSVSRKPFSKGAASNGRRERRKLKRKEQRVTTKIKKAAVNEDDVEELINARKRKQDILQHGSSLRNALGKKDIILNNYKQKIENVYNKISNVPLYAAVEEQKSQLTGAARPATEVYPEYYPEIYENMRVREKVQNLLEINRHNLSHNTRTFEYVMLKFLYAVRLMQYHQFNKALTVLQEILDDFDKEAKVFIELVTHRIVWIYIDRCDLLEARKLLEAYSESEKSFIMKWDIFFIEYVSCFVLKESTSEETVRERFNEAMNDNHGTLVKNCLLNHEQLDSELNSEEINESLSVEVETKLANFDIVRRRSLKEDEFFGDMSSELFYFNRSISFYRDAENIFEYMRTTKVDH